MSRLRWLLAAPTFFCLGCTSISSTLVNRTDSDAFVGNSNGTPKYYGQARPFTGVPITLRVPTHLDIAVKETIFLRTCAAKATLIRLRTTNRHLFVEPTLVETDKVFSVDVKRPAAGTLDYTMEFGDEANSQYFKEIKSKIVDKTIQDVTSALETVVPTLQKLASAKPTSAGGLPDVIPEDRVVAWKRFDLDAPDFEQQVGLFLEQHLNCCNTCRAYQAKNTQPSPTPAIPPALPPAK